MGQTAGYSACRFQFGVPDLWCDGGLFGVISGSLLWSLLSRSFRFEWFASFRDFLNHIVGAILMGFGGVLALGCTIGQGITGISTLALGSFIAFGGIVLGSALTMKIQYYKLVYEAEASFTRGAGHLTGRHASAAQGATATRRRLRCCYSRPRASSGRLVLASGAESVKG